MTEPDILDLDAARVARREAGRQPLPLRFGGKEICTLPAEMPLDVLQPIKALDLDLAILMRQAMTIADSESDGDAKKAGSDLVIDLLVARPSLPKEVIDAISEMGRRLLGEDGFTAFIAERPSPEDIGALVKGVLRQYGLSLGEAYGSSASSTDGGTTSTPISDASTASTPPPSGSRRKTPVSLASAGSAP